jgi:hypothetical protein
LATAPLELRKCIALIKVKGKCEKVCCENLLKKNKFNLTAAVDLPELFLHVVSELKARLRGLCCIYRTILKKEEVFKS